MPSFIGRLIQVGIGKEITRGIAVAPSFWLSKMNVTVEDKPEIVINDSTIGRIEDSVGGRIVLEGAEGEITGKLLDRSFGLLLLSAIGSVTSTLKSGETAVYNHTYSVRNDAQHPSLTIESKNPNEQLAFALAMLESLEIRAEIGKYVEYTATFKSKKGIPATNTPSYITENVFLSKHLTLKIADSIAGLDAAVAIPAKSVTLEITKNLERDDAFGSLDPADILNKQFGIEATIVLLYRDAVYKTFFKTGSPKAIRIDMKNTDVTIGVASNPQLRIDLAQAIFTGWEKTTGLEDLSVQTITAKATYKMAEAKMLDCVLTNTQASY